MIDLSFFRDQLRPLRFYDPAEGGELARELSCYAAGFEDIERRIGDLAHSFDPRGASHAALRRLAGLFAVDPEGALPDASLCAALEIRLSRGRGARPVAEALGLPDPPDITVQGGEITVRYGPGVPPAKVAAIRGLIGAMLPAHLAVSMQYGARTWEHIDSLGMTFAAIDAAGWAAREL